MNFGKVDSMEKMFKNYLSGKTLVSKNGEEILKTIVRVENVKCQNNTVFSATLKLFSFAHGTEEINVTVSFDKSVSADEIIICPYFSDYFEKSPLPDYADTPRPAKTYFADGEGSDYSLNTLYYFEAIIQSTFRKSDLVSFGLPVAEFSADGETRSGFSSRIVYGVTGKPGKCRLAVKPVTKH